MSETKRLRILVKGVVQGVGFRPFVYRSAVFENLKGFVANASDAVTIEVEGPPEAIDRFMTSLRTPPVRASVTSMENEWIDPVGDAEFAIVESRNTTGRRTLISPDIGICMDCLRELNDPNDRRYRYPFINCVNCGPRYTIIRGLPYDRPNTSMSSFRMCPACQREYDDPLDRRFHAQPNACPICGPKVWLTNGSGEIFQTDDPIREAANRLAKGEIGAVKGIGGYHLVCDAVNEEAVQRLRMRKGREEKPFAVMSADLNAIGRFASTSELEANLLDSFRKPIILLPKREPFPLAESVAPRNRFIGVMLPYAPLQAALMSDGRFTALVMTSGNVSEEPIAFRNDEALERLSGIADFFLLHDRDIEKRCDDSVVRVSIGLPRSIRRARGTAPEPVFLRSAMPRILAVGGELKNTVCLIDGDRAFLSPHVGDLENLETLEAFEEHIRGIEEMVGSKPEAVACDLHLDYLSTQWAEKQSLPVIPVQHHHAHIASCLAENHVDGPVIGIALDGLGYGTDGRIWGGELLIADPSTFTRAGHIAYRPMPGGPAAAREPWRMALSYLWSAMSKPSTADFLTSIEQKDWIHRIGNERIIAALDMIRLGMNSPLTSSMGRIFDGLASIAGIADVMRYEGQAALMLEMTMGVDPPEVSDYRFEIEDAKGELIFNPDSLILSALKDAGDGRPVSEISGHAHAAVAELLIKASLLMRERTGLTTVALSGGCFMNQFLLERMREKLSTEGFTVLTHCHVPTNDGGLSLGQAVVAANRIQHNASKLPKQ